MPYLNETFSLRGKHAVVTGGARGIGAAIAWALANAEASVTVLDIENGLETVKGLANSKGEQRHKAIVVDVSDEHAVETMWEKETTRVDILVNNAAVAPASGDDGLLKIQMDRLDQIMDVNYRGYLISARAIVSDMPAEGSRIFNISSIQGQACHSPLSTYQISKAAVDGLTRTLACEMGVLGINVIGIAPGAISTPGLGAHTAETIQSYREMIPLRRRGHAREIANVIVALSGRAGDYITGTTINVDGGYMANITPVDLVQPFESVPNDPDVD